MATIEELTKKRNIARSRLEFWVQRVAQLNVALEQAKIEALSQPQGHTFAKDA